MECSHTVELVVDVLQQMLGVLRWPQELCMECKHTVELVVDVLQQVRRRGHRQVVVAGGPPHKRPAAASMPMLRVQGIANPILNILAWNPHCEDTLRSYGA